MDCHTRASILGCVEEIIYEPFQTLPHSFITFITGKILEIDKVSYRKLISSSTCMRNYFLHSDELALAQMFKEIFHLDIIY